MRRLTILMMICLGAPFFSLAQSDLLLMRERAQLGDVNAQCNLGYLYAQGDLVTQDYVQAVYWWEKAATKGNSDAQYNLGTAYEAGTGVEHDRFQAAKWWRRAAEKGHAMAQWRLSICYTDGKWVKPDPERAAHWRTLAMMSGYTGDQKKGAGGSLKNLNSGESLSPVFSPSYSVISDLPIASEYTSPDGGSITVDLNRTVPNMPQEKIREKLLHLIEKKCEKANVKIYVDKRNSDNTHPSQAAYKILSEQTEDNKFTMKFEFIR